MKQICRGQNLSLEFLKCIATFLCLQPIYRDDIFSWLDGLHICNNFCGRMFFMLICAGLCLFKFIWVQEVLISIREGSDFILTTLVNFLCAFPKIGSAFTDFVLVFSLCFEVSSYQVELLGLLLLRFFIPSLFIHLYLKEYIEKEMKKRKNNVSFLFIFYYNTSIHEVFKCM